MSRRLPNEEQLLERLSRYKLYETIAKDATLPDSLRKASADIARLSRAEDAANDALARASAAESRARSRHQAAWKALMAAHDVMDAERNAFDDAEAARRAEVQP